MTDADELVRSLLSKAGGAAGAGDLAELAARNPALRHALSEAAAVKLEAAAQRALHISDLLRYGTPFKPDLTTVTGLIFLAMELATANIYDGDSDESAKLIASICEVYPVLVKAREEDP